MSELESNIQFLLWLILILWIILFTMLLWIASKVDELVEELRKNRKMETSGLMIVFLAF